MPKTDASFSPEQYATVADRIELFYERFPQGRINTELFARVDREITFKALVYRDSADTLPASTGWASEREGDGDINTVACLENTETSAVGRALANLGFTASTKRPSREEMEKVARVRGNLNFRSSTSNQRYVREPDPAARDDLLLLIQKAQQRGFSDKRAAVIRQLTSRDAGLPQSRVRKLEGSLRAWLRRREM